MKSGLKRMLGGPKVLPVCQSGSEAQQGRRSTMEDTHVHFDDVNDKYGFSKDVSRAFYAVYDGHGGRHAADLAEVCTLFIHAFLFTEKSNIALFSVAFCVGIS